MVYIKPSDRNDETLRDSKGRWLPGSPTANPHGRPRRVVEAEALATLNRVWNPEELAQVAAVLLSYAKAGNIAAANIIFGYTAGKPRESMILTNGGDEDLMPNVSDERIDQILADHHAAIEDQKRLANEQIDKLLIEQAKDNKRSHEIED